LNDNLYIQECKHDYLKKHVQLSFQLVLFADDFMVEYAFYEIKSIISFATTFIFPVRRKQKEGRSKGIVRERKKEREKLKIKRNRPTHINSEHSIKKNQEKIKNLSTKSFGF